VEVGSDKIAKILILLFMPEPKPHNEKLNIEARKELLRIQIAQKNFNLAVAELLSYAHKFDLFIFGDSSKFDFVPDEESISRTKEKIIQKLKVIIDFLEKLNCQDHQSIITQCQEIIADLEVVSTDQLKFTFSSEEELGGKKLRCEAFKERFKKITEYVYKKNLAQDVGILRRRQASTSFPKFNQERFDLDSLNSYISSLEDELDGCTKELASLES
jgi:vacuolar-type H+-ATPase subunit I/STV1